MQRPELFRETIADLRTRTHLLAREYDALATMLLLRKLLMDPGKNLTDAVGGGDGPYEVTGLPGPEGQVHLSSWTLDDEMSFERAWAQRFSFHANSELLKQVLGSQPISLPRASLTRSEFLDLVVVKNNGRSSTVHDVLYMGSYVAGGIHAGKATPGEQKALSDFHDVAHSSGMSHFKETVMGIAETTLHAMNPVLERLADEGQAGPRTD